MHLRTTVRYDAGIERVGTMLADSEFVEAKVRASGALSQSVEVVGRAGGAFTVTTRRHLPTTTLFAQLRSLAGPSLEVLQVEAWEAPSGGECRGTVVVEIVGAPVRLTGTLVLVAEPDGRTTGYVNAEVRASVPLFGATVEEATADAVRAAIEAEERTAVAWLAGPCPG